jgi:hypothetical protein
VSSRLLFWEKTVEKRKDFFDHHAFSWDKELDGKDRTHKAEEVVRWFRLTQNQSVSDVGTGTRTGILLPFVREVIGTKGRGKGAPAPLPVPVLFFLQLHGFVVACRLDITLGSATFVVTCFCHS